MRPCALSLQNFRLKLIFGQGMKRIGLVLLLFICLNGTAQDRFRAGLKAGIVTSQVQGDTYAGFNKLGFTGGALRGEDQHGDDVFHTVIPSSTPCL